MHWFGENWGANICKTCPQVPLPGTERVCMRCETPFFECDRGVVLSHHDGGTSDAPWHLECFLASVGGVEWMIAIDGRRLHDATVDLRSNPTDGRSPSWRWVLRSPNKEMGAYLEERVTMMVEVCAARRNGPNLCESVCVQSVWHAGGLVVELEGYPPRVAVNS